MKSKIINFKDKLVEEIIKFIFMIMIYFFYNKDLYSNKDFITRIRDSSAILIPYLIYLIFISISSLFMKPITINIMMKNFRIDKQETDLFHFKNFCEDAQTIALDLKIEKNTSIWACLARRLFKSKILTLKIFIETYEENFMCQPCQLSDEIDFRGSSFTIDISNIVLSNLRDNIPDTVNYNFVVKENEDNPLMRGHKCYIKPMLLINNKQIGYFQKIFIKYITNLKDGMYLINFVR